MIGRTPLRTTKFSVSSLSWATPLYQPDTLRRAVGEVVAGDLHRIAALQDHQLTVAAEPLDQVLRTAGSL
jgi:hypothetical protein